jgi:hypothetical protein
MITKSNIDEPYQDETKRGPKKNLRVIKRKRLNNGIQSVKNPENDKKIRKKSNPKGKLKIQD